MSSRWQGWKLASQQLTIAQSLRDTSALTLSRPGSLLLPLPSSSWTGRSSTKLKKYSTIERSEVNGSTSFSGKIRRKPRGSGKGTYTDAWNSSRTTSEGLESKGAFYRLSSPVKCPQGLRENLLSRLLRLRLLPLGLRLRIPDLELDPFP